MNILELIKLAFKNILSFKLRSFLINVRYNYRSSSVILISSIGAGFKNSLLMMLKEVSKIFSSINKWINTRKSTF